MPTKLTESRADHRGEELPEGVYLLLNEQGEAGSYKARWRELDGNGVDRQRSKSFSPRKLGSLDRARSAAVGHREAAVQIVREGASVLRPDKALKMTLGELFKEWIKHYAAVECGERYATDSVRTWDKDIEPRLGRVRIGAVVDDPGIIPRFHDELRDAGVAISARRAALSLLRAVLNWGRRRYPRALNLHVTGLFKVPQTKGRRLRRATDAIAIERIIEAALKRRHRDSLSPLRDAALIAAQGFTIASRPSEWLHSVTLADVRPRTVDLQAARNDVGDDAEDEVGLKTGARAALLLPNGYDRVIAYLEAVEARYGKQPDHALVFQVLTKEGPLWDEDGFPVPWSQDHYYRWRARVWRPACQVAAKAPDTENWIGELTFYELRHTAISLALHSTLVMTDDGMNLHTLSGWSGHDVQTLQRYYAHLIARYRNTKPINIEKECAAARRQVKRKPFTPEESAAGPQREAQRRRRARARAVRVVQDSVPAVSRAAR